jgi:very-short-patch-repair endonuclease
MHDIHETVRRLGNVATRAQLLRLGYRPRELTDAVRSGVLQRLRRGHYINSGATQAQRAAITMGGRLACSSAASTYGLWSGSDATLHLAVPPTASRVTKPASTAVRLHWQQNLAESDSWRVGLPECLRGVVRCSSAESAIATLDTAISLGMANELTIRRIFAGEPIASRLVASRARAGSDSGVESLARQRLQRRGHDVRQQVVVPGVGRVDMQIDEQLFVEIDGFEFHSSPRHFAADRRRDAAFVLGGHRRLRFAAVDVLRRWDWVEKTIVEALGVSRVFI